jgi:hypothetical protein
MKMPANTFDSAGLGVVAYAEIIGATGASTNTNSGVTTSRIGTGLYSVTLLANQQQSGSRDLIFVTPKGTITAEPYSHKVDDTSSVATKYIAIYGGSPLASYADSDFSLLILRTTITPPAGAPA